MLLKGVCLVGSSLLLLVKLNFIHSLIILVSTFYQQVANKVKKRLFRGIHFIHSLNGCLRYSASHYA